MTSRTLKLSFFVLATCLFAPRLCAQSTEAKIAARLIGKPLFLRGFWRDNKLNFDAQGQPAKKYAAVGFTQAAIDVTAVKMNPDHLEIDGKRMVLEFDE